MLPAARADDEHEAKRDGSERERQAGAGGASVPPFPGRGRRFLVQAPARGDGTRTRVSGPGQRLRPSGCGHRGTDPPVSVTRRSALPSRGRRGSRLSAEPRKPREPVLHRGLGRKIRLGRRGLGEWRRRRRFGLGRWVRRGRRRLGRRRRGDRRRRDRRRLRGRRGRRGRGHRVWRRRWCRRPVCRRRGRRLRLRGDRLRRGRRRLGHDRRARNCRRQGRWWCLPHGQKQERVDVAARIGRRPDPEMHIGNGELRRPARANRADGVAFRHGRTLVDVERAEMRE
jgi:hypothetical protein